jgi:hypothetical protein
VSRDPYRLVKPCAKCPFRTDIPPFLGSAARVTEIERSLERGAFNCHETLDYKRCDEDGAPAETEHTAHCAGALILLEKLGRSSQLMRIGERLGLYDPRKLDMTAPVFESFGAMRLAQRNSRKSTKGLDE